LILVNTGKVYNLNFFDISRSSIYIVEEDVALFKLWEPRTDLRTLERRLGYQFADRALLVRSLTPQNSTKKRDSYQLLEYFGDGALRYVIPHILKERYPHASHGELTRMYSLITCNTNLAFMAYRLRLPYYIRFPSRPNINRKLLADIVEAIIGAVDQSGGVADVTKVCERLFQLDLEVARFHEPQDTLLRMLQNSQHLALLKHLKSRAPKVSYQVHVIHKPWGKLGHVSVLRLDGQVIVGNGEGYDAESANSHAAALALLKLFPSKFPSKCSKFSWRI
jgi:ribonuclease III